MLNNDNDDDVYRRTSAQLKLKRIHLVWLSRDINEFSLFTDTICNLTQMVCNVIFLKFRDFDYIKWNEI